MITLSLAGPAMIVETHSCVGSSPDFTFTHALEEEAQFLPAVSGTDV